MINTSPGPRPGRRRLALAGVLGGTVLAVGVGAGAAYASSTGAGSEAVESGYATVVDGAPARDGARADCPERSTGEGSERGPSQTSQQSPEQTPAPEGDL